MREAPQLELRAQGRGRGLGSGSEAHPRSDTTSLAEYGRVVSVQRGSHCQSVSRNLTSSLTERFSTACCAQGAGQAWRTRCARGVPMVGRGSERAGRGMWPAVLSSRAAEVVVRAWRPRSTRIITAGYALGLSDALVVITDARRNPARELQQRCDDCRI